MPAAGGAWAQSAFPTILSTGGSAW
jgi:hypothetical protein